MSGICARGSIGIEGNCVWGRSSIVAEKPGRPAHVVYAHFAAAILENAQLTKAVNSERRGGARDRHGEREVKDGHSNHNETEDRSHAPVFISFPRPWLTRSTSLTPRPGPPGRPRGAPPPSNLPCPCPMLLPTVPRPRAAAPWAAARRGPAERPRRPRSSVGYFMWRREPHTNQPSIIPRPPINYPTLNRA